MENGLTDDTDAIAFAAEAAAKAVEAADAASAQIRQNPHLIMDESQLVCRICGRGNEDGRPLLRFLPVTHDMNAAAAAPGVVTFVEDICLHIFCGKTASILPNVNQPDLEILTKAGLKNKHGIGPEVNAALARTRCAILHQEGSKEKHFYLVREFEAHLAAIRNTHITYIPDLSDAFPPPQHDIPPVNLPSHYPQDPEGRLAGAGSTVNVNRLDHPKVTPLRAAAGHINKPGRRYEDTIPYGQGLTEDGKVRCPCGGTHLPTGTPRGAASWRNHVTTKRHQKWMEQNGMLGTV